MEFVVEPVVSELFKGLFKILGSNEVRDFARNLVGGIDSELDKLKRMLEMVQDLLNDAEEKKLNNNGAVKRWLDDLQDWAYDAEDILDEFAYKASQRKLKEEHQASSSKGLNCLPSCFTSPLFNVHMGSKIKDITSNFEKLCKLRTDLGFQVSSAGTSGTTLLPRPEQTSSVQPENFVYGRDEDEAKLVEMAVKSDQPSGENFRVIAIVGMGGIGKTTIARKIYNHMQELEDFKFEKKAWVCVSNNFDVLTISKALLESIDSSPSSPNNLNEVQVKLRETVNQKRFLLVLDDVWNDEYAKLEVLKSPFKAGAPGSTMIITTRLESVASAIRSSVTYPLKPISDYHCWQLFQEHAFGDGSIAEAHEIHDSIRKGVVERCRGLPLAAKTLGGLLHSKPCDTWGKILNSNIWSTSNESDHILPALRLSYHYLPSNLKRCFAYCALFPKDYEFKEKELVLLWMAEGIVQPTDKQLDEAGEYFHDLCSRSLLQKWSSHSSIYVMHDLVHDLAESVFKEIDFRYEKSIIDLPENFQKTRHFSYLPNTYDTEKKFKCLEKLKSLRTFLPVFMQRDTSYRYISAPIIFYLLSKLEKLRVLSLERYYITHLPDSIGNLIHLRYLNFSQTMIKSLPESTSQLFNLQTLLLKDCHCLMKLPSNTRYLTNLYHFDISGQNLLKEMPSRMKELKNLRILSNFIVGKEPSLNLEDLKSLNFLKGELHISKLENATDPHQIGGQILSNKNNLEVLLLEWGYFDDSRKEDVEMLVLDKLKPPSSLIKLTIKRYGGESFPPSWFKDPTSVSNLVVLKLKNCKRCKSLPSLEMLSSLKNLTIIGMASLKRIDFDIPLKSLEVLRFMNLQEWEQWDTWRGNKDVERLAQLRELCIEECPKLTGEFRYHLPSLERFIIRDSPKLVISVSSLPKECKVWISLLNKGVVYNDSSINFEWLDSRWQGFQRVDFLTIDDSDESTSWESLLNIERFLILGGIHGLTFLEQFLPYLKVLEFKNCNILISLPGELKQKNLEILTIDECDSLRSIDCSMLPSSLKRLRISSCEKLEFLKDLSISLLEELRIIFCHSLTCTSLSQLPETLQDLVIFDCNKLKTLSRCQYLPKALTSLDIGSCRELKSIDGSFENSTGLRNICLYDCEKLESIPQGLQNLSRVDSLYIQHCPELLVRENVPTSLIKLCIVGGLKFDKPMIEWELHNLRAFYICDYEDAASILQNLTSLASLTKLNIQSCPIESIPNITSLTSLTTLTIQRCPMLESIPNLTSLTSLTELLIEECPRIESIPNLTSLTSLTGLSIQECPRIESIPNLTSLASLRFLSICECGRLKSIPALGNVEYLVIRRCPKLKSRQSLPSSLLALWVSDCPLLTKPWKRGKKRYCSKIAHIPKVEIDDKFIFNSKEEESD